MKHRSLGTTKLKIAPVVLGGNVFGWTIDQKRSFEVLDAFVDQGFNAIDTADIYTVRVPGNKGGESETIIGNWLKARPQLRDSVVVITKGGGQFGSPERKGLSRRWLNEAVEGSLRRLAIDAIDLYFSHFPDPATPEEETLRAYEELINAGKIKSIGVSNADAGQLRRSLELAAEVRLPAYQVVQPEYNLYDRADFEGPLRDVCLVNDLGVLTYYSLASGFLTGKYRDVSDLGQSARGGNVGKYLDAKGRRILTALDAVSQAHSVTPAEVALSWLIVQPGVTAPIASATSVAQVEAFGRAASLALTQEEMELLTQAGR